MGFYPFLPLPASGSNILPPVVLTGATAGTALLTTALTTDTNPEITLFAGNGASAGIGLGSGAAVPDTFLFRQAAGTLRMQNTLQLSGGSLDVITAGQGLKVNEGANGKQGTFTLSGAATTVVANTSVTANSRILMTTQTLGTVTAASTLCVSARTAGTSFTVTPSQSTDTSVVAFEIFEPG